MLQKCDVRHNLHSPNTTIKRYGTDQSGEVIYRFNSLGFRGEAYNPNAKMLIYVGGCSHTFGTGVNIEDGWPFQFKQNFIRHTDLTDKETNLLNFAVGGHSNDYITRVLLTQPALVKPDLVIVHFTHMSRAEYVDAGKIYALNVGSIDIDKLDGLSEAHQNFFYYYTEEVGMINLLKNMLLLQTYFQTNDIPYLFSCVDLRRIFVTKEKLHPICKQYVGLLARDFICDFRLDRFDAAADATKNAEGELVGGHPGPQSQKRFAKKLLAFYEQKILKSANR